MRLPAALAAGAAAAAMAAAAWAQTPPAAGPATDAGLAPAVGEGEDGRYPPTDPNDPWIWGDVAVLRGLDKVTAQTRDFRAPVDQDVQFFALTISVKRCAKRPPERTPETIVGMEIYDRQTDGTGEESDSRRVFSGWMFGSSPALNPLEHPVYDVWVLDCVRSDGDAATAEAPGAPADTPQPGGAPD